MTDIAVLGLGAMGSRMSARLIDSGHALTVWNRSPAALTGLIDRPVRIAASPAEAAEGAEVVIAMVRDDEASRAVWLDAGTGAIHGLSPDAVAIDSATLTPGWTRTLGRALAERGAAFLEAPVAGSRHQAEAGQLIYFIGGDPAVLARVEPVLRVMGGAVHAVGPLGSGAVVKLAVNSLFGIQVAAMAELIGLMRRCGLEPAAALEVIGATPVCSPAAKGAGAAMLSDAFPPLFPVDLVAKDLNYTAATAAGVGARMPMAEAAGTVFSDAIAAGLGADNLTVVARLYR
jgi:3-hydroxyisobutyrate dehydrogenase-like beta-hydroxyacid dehydrogenase